MTVGPELSDAELLDNSSSPYLKTFRILEGSGDASISPAGAVGRYQIMPATAQQYGYDPSQLKDPKVNEQAAKSIISDLNNRYQGNLPAMAIAYNAGPGRANKWLASGEDNSTLPAETQKYLSHLGKLSQPKKGELSDADLMAQMPAPKPGELTDADLLSSQPPTQSQTSSTMGALARGAERGALPTAGGFAGAIAGGEAGAGLGSIAGPWGTAIGGIGGGIAGALGGGYLIDKAQQSLINHLPDSVQKFIGQDQAQQQADVQAHPYASMIGELAPQAAVMGPGAASSVVREGASALERAMASPTASRLFGAGIMGGQQAGQEYAQNGQVDPTSVAIAAGAGALLNKPTGLGEAIASPIHQVFRGPEIAPAQQPDNTALAAALQQHYAQQQEPVTPPPQVPVPAAPPPGMPPVEPVGAPPENNVTAIQRKMQGNGGEPARVSPQPSPAVAPVAVPEQPAEPPGGVPGTQPSAPEPVHVPAEAPGSQVQMPASQFHPVLQGRLEDIASSSPAGKSFVQDLTPKLQDGSISPTQAYFAIAHIGDALQRVLGGTDSDLAVKLMPELLTPSGSQAQGQFDPTQALLQFSLHPDALQYANETGGHEAFHVLQQTFGVADPRAAKALNKTFSDGMTLDSLPPALQKRLQGTIYPVQPEGAPAPVTYWDQLVKGQGGADKPFTSQAEAEAHIFGAIDSMRTHGIETPALSAPFQRFSKFIGDFKTRVVNGLQGAGFQTPEDVMNAYSAGKAGELSAAPGTLPVVPNVAAEQEQDQPQFSARQTDEPAGFYSPTLRAIEALPGDDSLEMSGDKWKNVLASNLGKQKFVDWRGEQDYIGLDKFLDGKDSVTKGELADYVLKNIPVLERQNGDQYNDMNILGGEGYNVAKNNIRGLQPALNGPITHFGPENITHNRTEIVDTPDGPKTVQIEGQSDLHQNAAALRAAEVRRLQEEMAASHERDSGKPPTQEELAGFRKAAASKVLEDYGYYKDQGAYDRAQKVKDLGLRLNQAYKEAIRALPESMSTPERSTILRGTGRKDVQEYLLGKRKGDADNMYLRKLMAISPEGREKIRAYMEANNEMADSDPMFERNQKDMAAASGKSQPAPLQKNWHIFNFKQVMQDAATNGHTGVLFPSTPEQVRRAEKWPNITEKDGRYYTGQPERGEGFYKDVTPIVKRAIKTNPEEYDRWLKGNGYKGMEKYSIERPGGFGKDRLELHGPDGNPVIGEDGNPLSWPADQEGELNALDERDRRGLEDTHDLATVQQYEPPVSEEFWHAPVDRRMKDAMPFWSARHTDYDGEFKLPEDIAYSRRKAAADAAGIPGLDQRMSEVYAPINPKLSLLDRTKNMGQAANWQNAKKFYMRTVDEAYPLAPLDKEWAKKNAGLLTKGKDIIERSTGDDLAFELSSYKMRAMVNRSAAQAGTDMFTAPFALTKDGDFTVSKVDKAGNIVKPEVQSGPYKGKKLDGLMQIWAPAYRAGIGEAFHFYMDAQRGLRLAGEGREKLFKPSDKLLADQLEQKFNGKDGNPDFKEMADLTHEFNKVKLDGMVKAGVLTRSAADHYLSTGDYTPFYRDFEQEGVAGPVYVSGVNTGESVLHRKLKGGEALLADPLERWYRHLQALNHAMTSNESAARAMDQALDVGVARIAKAGDKDNVITVRRNGEKIKYVVEDPLLHESLAATDGRPVSAMMNIFRIPTNILRQFTTHVPTFILMHAMRESMTGFVTGDFKPLVPIIDALRGIKNSLTNSASSQAISAHGIIGNFDYRPGSGQDRGDMLRARAAKQLGINVTPVTGMKGLLHTVWGKYENVLKAADAGVRTRVYEIEMAKHGNPAEAAYQAGAKAVNFQRRGSSPFMSYAFSAIPFLNARIQGTDLILRTAVNQGKAHGVAGVLFSRGMAMAAMTGAYYMAVRNNDTYKKAATIYKDGYWIVPMNMFGGDSTEAVVMPIPFEAGVLYKNVPEHILRLMTGDDKAPDFQAAMERTLMGTLDMNPIPQVARPTVEVIANHSFYTGRQIVPEGRQMPGARKFEVEPGTSMLAKKLGEATGYSPIDIDYLVRGYLGTVGEWTAEASDVAGRFTGDVPPLPSQFMDNPTMANTPLLKRFVRDSSQMGDEELDRLYDLHGETQGLVRTLNRMQGANDVEGVQRLTSENRGSLSVKDVANAVFGQISQINKMEVNIQGSATMNAEDKAQMIKMLEDRKYTLASTVEQMRDTKKQVGAMQ